MYIKRLPWPARVVIVAGIMIFVGMFLQVWNEKVGFLIMMLSLLVLGGTALGTLLWKHMDFSKGRYIIAVVGTLFFLFYTIANIVLSFSGKG